MVDTANLWRPAVSDSYLQRLAGFTKGADGEVENCAPGSLLLLGMLWLCSHCSSRYIFGCEVSCSPGGLHLLVHITQSSRCSRLSRSFEPRHCMGWRRLPTLLAHVPLRTLPLSEQAQKTLEQTGHVSELAFKTIPSIGKVLLG